MNMFKFYQFSALLKKEFWENRTLILGAPAVLALVLFVINFLVVSQIGDEQLSLAMGYLNFWFYGQNPLQTGPITTLLSLPFVIVFFFCSVIYLLNALYHDRKDMSILFWQSMPVSNFQTVISKIATVVVVSPAFTVVAMALLYLFTTVYLTAIGLRIDAEISGFAYMLSAILLNLGVVYLFIATSALWLLPMIGWLLLFSAFARKAPMLWAIGVYSMMSFVEGFVFNTQFLSNWAQTRADPDNYLIIDFSGIVDRLFSYDMLVGWVVGAVLISGAVYMRRYAD